METGTAVTVHLASGDAVSDMLLAAPYSGAGDVHLKPSHLGGGAPCMYFAHHVQSVQAATPPVDCPTCHRTLYWCQGH